MYGLRWDVGVSLTCLCVLLLSHVTLGGDLVLSFLRFGLLLLRLYFLSVFLWGVIVPINLSLRGPDTRKSAIPSTLQDADASLNNIIVI